ncbi:MULTISPECIES: response regulator [unclassified Polaribacter]|uniref:response regulator n=1 Tax=unclassified Polaribacter TaxID=196858 RepID=UPI0011BDF8A4|nr:MULTISPECIES: response regulator transcription factor [unclassified Polaribacter]TXD52651.1 response regulator transcription factor [Polaribacter sp. IC063]TXD60620.1 response regulator transcription factor [Polaribacter sp. IC066]
MGLRNIIEQKSNMRIVGEASDGREAIKMCAKLLPNVVVMDVAMPGLNGIESAKQIHKNNPEIRIIGLSMHSGKQFIQGMFKAGAFGYLLKDGDADELITAIITVIENRKYLSKDINQEYLILLKKGESLEKTPLSSREKEVLQLIAEGKTSKKIGEILFVSSKTVDVHRNNIMKKIDLYSIPELTKYAIQKGITSLDM